MSLRKKIGEVLPGMLLTGEEERDLPLTCHGEHARGEGPASSFFIDRRQYLHRRIVVMDDLALRRLPYQFLIRQDGRAWRFFLRCPTGWMPEGERPWLSCKLRAC